MKKFVLLLICTILIHLSALNVFCAEWAEISEIGWINPKGAQVIVTYCGEIPEGAVTVELYNSSDELVSSAAIQYKDMEHGVSYSDGISDLYTVVDFFEGDADKDTYYFVVMGLGEELKSDVYYYGKMLDIIADGNYGVSYSDCFDDKIYIGIVGRGDTPYCWEIDYPDMVEEKSVLYVGLPYHMLARPVINLHEYTPVKEGEVRFHAKLKTPPGANGVVVAEFYLTYKISKDLKVTFDDWEFTGFRLPDDEAYYVLRNYLELYQGYDKNVVIPDEVDSEKIFGIGPDAFRANEDVISVEIPEGIISIVGDQDYNSYPFLGASALERITVDKNNPVFKDIDGVLVDKETNQLLFYPENKQGEVYKIPEEIVSLRTYSFYEPHNLKYVYVDNDSLEFEPDAFGYTDVTFVCRRGSTAEAYAAGYSKYKVRYIAEQGDADASGVLTSNDAAVALALTLDNSFENDTYELNRVCDVNGDGIVSANDASCILQKVINRDFKKMQAVDNILRVDYIKGEVKA